MSATAKEESGAIYTAITIEFDTAGGEDFWAMHKVLNALHKERGDLSFGLVSSGMNKFEIEIPKRSAATHVLTVKALEEAIQGQGVEIEGAGRAL